MSFEIIVRAPTKEEQEKAKSWPIWEKEASTFDWTYSQTEHCLLLEGEVEVTEGSKKWSFKKGDYVILPKGLTCVWHVIKDVKKHYNFE